MCGLSGGSIQTSLPSEAFFVEHILFSTISPDRPFLSLCSTSWAHILLISSRRSLKQQREGENIVTTATPSYTGVQYSLITAVNVNLLKNFLYSYLLLSKSNYRYFFNFYNTPVLCDYIRRLFNFTKLLSKPKIKLP